VNQEISRFLSQVIKLAHCETVTGSDALAQKRNLLKIFEKSHINQKKNIQKSKEEAPTPPKNQVLMT
jgi:hypothetical protein